MLSFLDDDLYKFTQGEVVFHHFPRVKVKYKFFNRHNTEFPLGFDSHLRGELNALNLMKMTKEEKNFLLSIKFLSPAYIDWLSNYRFDQSEVKISQVNNDLKIEIEGYWYRTIFWEVRLMSIISQLYFELTGKVGNMGSFVEKTDKKGDLLSQYGCDWIDFGTRRRFSYDAQSACVSQMKNKVGFLGTSNVHFAMKYNVKPHGTYAHESIMAMSAKYGVKGANSTWMRLWAEHFNGNLGIALTDTFTTDYFLEDFGIYEAKLFDGVRQDSGCPYVWADEKIIPHFEKLGVDLLSKKFVFSDNLKVGNPDDIMIGDSYNYIPIALKYQNKCNPIAGIGTYFTNDFGHKPLNMVIKLTDADFGQGYRPVVKLSDNSGKHTGNYRTVKTVQQEVLNSNLHLKLHQIQELDKNDEPDNALDVIFKWFGAMLRNKDYENIDRILISNEVYSLSFTSLIGILNVTLNAKKFLENRDSFYRIMEEIAFNKGYDQKLLKGLE